MAKSTKKKKALAKLIEGPSAASRKAVENAGAKAGGSPAGADGLAGGIKPQNAKKGCGGCG